MSTREQISEGVAGPHHFLHFYKANEQAFTRKVSEYLREGLQRGEGVLVVADPEHRNAFAQQLRLQGVDLDSAIDERQAVFVDSRQILDQYMIDGQPVWERFEAIIATAIRKAQPRTNECGRRAYGDMVGLLWKDRMFSAAVCVEEFWNKLLAPMGCQLFCGYPIDVFETDFQMAEIKALLHAHTHVISSDEHGDIERSMHRAAREILGQNAVRFQILLPQDFAPSETLLPRAEAKMLWLRNHHPDEADTILARARQHYPSERRFRALIENSSDVLSLTDPDGAILYASPASARVLGLTPEELVGQNGFDLIHPEDRVRVSEKLRCVLRQPRCPVQIEARIRRKDGSWAWIESITSNLLDDPEVRAIVSNFRDVTVRKTAEEALVVSQERLASRERYLQTVLDSLPECVKILGPQGELLDMNRAGLAMIEADVPAQVLGACVYPLIDAPDRAAFQALNESVFHGGTGGRLEFAINSLKGAHLSFESQVVPLRDETDAVIGALSATRNITERKQAELARFHLASIVESSHDAIISKDLDGRIMTWNQAAERMFGYTAEEILGRPISVLAVADHPTEMPDILARIRRGERVEHYETTRRRKDGQILTISLAVSPIRNAAGKIIGASKIARDITEQKRAEEMLQQTNEALRQANSDLGQFAYATAHDLQEPLRMVSIYSQKLQRQCAGTLQGSAKEYLGYLEQGARRMELLIRDILVYSQAANTAFAPDVLTDANQAVNKALSYLDGAIQESGAEVTCETLPVLRIADGALVQLFQNLIGNAIKYHSEEPPRIHISTSQQGTHRKVLVRDNGLGIAPQYTKQVFGLFKRLHRHEQYPGTGVGLAICQKIVERSGGQIWVESAGEGEGSTFCFTLPSGA